MYIEATHSIGSNWCPINSNYSPQVEGEEVVTKMCVFSVCLCVWVGCQCKCVCGTCIPPHPARHPVHVQFVTLPFCHPYKCKVFATLPSSGEQLNNDTLVERTIRLKKPKQSF